MMHRNKECTVAREMKINEGPKERGKKWFPQLVDKRKDIFTIGHVVCIHIHSTNTGRSVKIHHYWAMKNCGDSPSKLQEPILKIPSLPGTLCEHLHLLRCSHNCRVLYTHTHRASTLNAHLPHLATHQPTH